MKTVSGQEIKDLIAKYFVKTCLEFPEEHKPILYSIIGDERLIYEHAEKMRKNTSYGMPDLYKAEGEVPFLHCKYLDEIEQDGKKYMLFTCWIWFGEIFCPYDNFGFFNEIPSLPYYELVEIGEDDDGTVGSHVRANKLYSIDIDLDDFPDIPMLDKEQVKDIFDNPMKKKRGRPKKGF